MDSHSSTSYSTVLKVVSYYHFLVKGFRPFCELSEVKWDSSAYSCFHNMKTYARRYECMSKDVSQSIIVTFVSGAHEPREMR